MGWQKGPLPPGTWDSRDEPARRGIGMRLALAALLIVAAATRAAPPALEIPPEVRAVGDYVIVQPKTDAKSVVYVARSGVEPFPSAMLADRRAFVLPVRGLPVGRYLFTAVGSLNDEQAVAAFAVVVGDAPPPGPAPTPPGPAPPGPTPPPQPVAGMRVLILYESADLSKYPAGQVASLYARVVRDYLDGKCPVGPDGKTKEWRIWDKDVDARGESQFWQDAIKVKPPALPAVVVFGPDGKSVLSTPLPGTVDETLALLRKIGG